MRLLESTYGPKYNRFAFFWYMILDILNYGLKKVINGLFKTPRC
jgi:hypothetical protein